MINLDVTIKNKQNTFDDLSSDAFKQCSSYYKLLSLVPLENQKDKYYISLLMDAAGISSTSPMDISLIKKSFDRVDYSFSITDVTTKNILYCNEAFANRYGYSLLDLLAGQYVPEDLMDFVRVTREGFIENLTLGQPVKTMETHILNSSNDHKWFVLHSNYNTSLNLLCMASSEITQNKLNKIKHHQMLENVKASEEKLRNFFVNSQIGFFRSDFKTGKILDCNIKLSEILGYSSTEELKKTSNFSMLARNIGFIESWDHLRKVVNQKGKISNYETMAERLMVVVLILIFHVC